MYFRCITTNYLKLYKNQQSKYVSCCSVVVSYGETINISMCEFHPRISIKCGGATQAKYFLENW